MKVFALFLKKESLRTLIFQANVPGCQRAQSESKQMNNLTC